MIKNRKGQALIEFVLILPILVLLLLGIMDIGIVFVKKSELDNKVTDIIKIWEQKYTSIEELEILLKDEDLKTEIIENTTTSFVTVKVKDEVDLTTPIIKKINIEVKRVIPLE